MCSWNALLRTVSLWLLAVWLGGFTFYSAVVIPILHERLGSAREAGPITQRATDRLNLIGLAAVATAWPATLAAGSSGAGGRRARRVAVALLALTTVCLLLLFGLHRALDARLEAGAMRGFYPWHRAYLWVSTVQWLANLGLLACWGRRPASRDVT